MAGGERATLDAYAAFSRGDIDAVLAGMHPEIEWEIAFPFPEGEETYHGHDGVRRFWSKMTDVFDEWTVEPEEVLAVSDGRVLVVLRERLRGRGSDMPLEQMNYHLLTRAADGRIARLQAFPDRETALEAAGSSRA